MRFVSMGLLAVYVSVSLHCGAQQARDNTAAPSYAGEPMVLDHANIAYVMNADGTGYAERTVAARLQSDAAVQAVSVVALPFASAIEHVEFKYARVRHPDGTVTETPISDVIEQPEQVTVQAPFYSDLKEAQLPIKGMRVGDTLEWQARIVRTKAEASGEFWGQEIFPTDAVVLQESVTLSVPAGSAVTVWTNPKTELKAVESTEGDRHVYRWERVALKTTAERAEETEKAKTKVLSPDEVVDAEEGKLPDVAWTTFKTWAAVGAWYRGLEGDRETPNDEVKTKVADLTANKTTEEAKVRAVYGYVSAQIRYIGVAFGVGRYQPHRSDAVMENQYGDCKDKHTLLASMLLALGLHPDAVLIGAGVRFNAAVPSPSAFNHMITRVQVDGKEVWLDATAEVAPYQMLTKTIRNKQALVVPDSGPARIETSPKDAPFLQMQAWVSKGAIDTKGVSESHITLTMRGDAELIFRQVLRQVPPTQYDAFAKKFLEQIGYQGAPTHTLISRPDVTEEPLTISFDYHREQAGDWPNHRIIAQLAPLSLPTVDDKSPPVLPIDLQDPRTEVSTAELAVPAGWSVELPEAVHEKTEFATYDLTYRFEKGTLYAERRLVVLKERVPAEEWKSYKKWQDAISIGLENYIQLTRTGDSGDGGKKVTVPADKSDSGDTTVPTDISAEKLIQQAGQALKDMDMAEAKKLLDQANKVNPSQRGLWAAYGAVAMALGERNEAIKDLARELSAHPDMVVVYPMLTSLHQQGNDNAASEATLRRWIAADTLDARPVTMLMAMLYQDGKYADALLVGDAAMKQLSDEQTKDEQFQLNYGQAEMKAGRVDKGSEAIIALLKTSDNPLTLNNAAYSLSEANVNLPLAEQSVRTALDKLTKETQSWTLDEARNTMVAQSSLLVASWDTLGWILFREGKLAEAQSYCEAAWLNDLHDEVGGHVVTIREAIAKPEQAAELERAKEGKGQSAEPKKSNQELRTVAMGPAEGRAGVGQYRLLILHGVVERAEPEEDRAVDRGAEMLQKAKLAKYTPEGSDAKLMKEAMLNCHAGKCELVFMQ